MMVKYINKMVAISPSKLTEDWLAQLIYAKKENNIICPLILRF